MAKRKSGKKKGKRKGKKGKGTLGLLALGAGALYLLLKRKAPAASASANVQTSEKLKPEPVEAGERIGVMSYRLIASRRPGMRYDKGEGTPGPNSELTFDVSKKGIFTRNFVLEGGVPKAEIA